MMIMLPSAIQLRRKGPEISGPFLLNSVERDGLFLKAGCYFNGNERRWLFPSWPRSEELSVATKKTALSVRASP